MFKTVFSNLKMMINTSTFSKGLIIFLVYYLTIISTVTIAEKQTQEENVIIEIDIQNRRVTLNDILAEDNAEEFQQNIVDENEENLTTQQISQIMGSIQLGVKHEMKIRTVTPVSFPSDFNKNNMQEFRNWHDSNNNRYPNFFFYIYAPLTFHYFRHLFGINSEDYTTSFCNSPLRELSNPGASKSIFYLTPDDKFIMKSVQQTEDQCLVHLLSKYTTYLTDNRESLLPKFSGFYGFQCNSISNKIVTMNNLLPSGIKMHQKFDLKGSTLGRNASVREKRKKSPTYKDLDFKNELHPRGLFLKTDTRLALLKTIANDCEILKEFNIMDYSILMGVHNIDHHLETDDNPSLRSAAILRWERLMADSVEGNIQAWTLSEENYASLSGSIPAKSVNGDRLLLFVGIIDILQTFRRTKSLEHRLKSIKLKVTPCQKETADSISVQHPGFYKSRFLEFMTNSVFKPMLSPEELNKLSKQPIDIQSSSVRRNSKLSIIIMPDCLK
ncbi:phosphatidylinositol 4-phosphate 5-kinase type-1 beta-like [Metopolophium dirhodum]|uniref:phosphatidylinositol 4-phosphate 5-kinase type-1 beta-like n=1 Tax=Metopolophium dirhodum TaxID=44670 RepID=UPI00298F7677|nr:phosphatidylinositol 4-phosphate 5-kinase type-1 beta-like [Metopolophium dirhodum]